VRRRATAAGDVDPTARDDGRTVYELADSKARLLTYGNDIEAEDQRLFSTILTQFETVLDHEDLQRKANEVEPLAAADKIRSALLSALSHDLRRPLSSATAAISGFDGGIRARWGKATVRSCSMWSTAG
jgi:two-component system sensor histidine kinase KdpD